MTRSTGRRRSLGRLSVLAILAIVVTVTPASAMADPVEPAAGTVQTFYFDSGQGTLVRVGPKVASDFPSGNVYCTLDYTGPGCLKRLKGEVTYLGCGKQSGGGDVDTLIHNPTGVRAPRDISGFIREAAGGYHHFFGDRDWAPRGRTTVRYRGLPDGNYAFSTGWDDQGGLTFYGGMVTIDCGNAAAVRRSPGR